MIGRVVVWVAMAWALTACSPSAASVQTAIAQTQAADPTATIAPTATPILLSSIDIESLLLKSGDLSSDFELRQIKSQPPDYIELPKWQNLVFTEIGSGDFVSDGYLVALYDDENDLQSAYDTLTKALKSHHENFDGKAFVFKDSDKVGDRAVVHVSENDLFAIYSSSVVFTNCHALVWINIFSPSATEDVLISFAQRVENRLANAVC